MQLINTISAVISAVFDWLSYKDNKKRLIEQPRSTSENQLHRKKAEAVLGEIQNDVPIISKIILFFVGTGLLVFSLTVIGSLASESEDVGVIFFGGAVGWFAYVTAKFIVKRRIAQHMLYYDIAEDNDEGIFELRQVLSRGRWTKWYVKWFVKKIIFEVGREKSEQS